MDIQTIAVMAGGDPAVDLSLPPDRLGVVEELRVQRQRVRASQARELALAAHYAELCGEVADSGTVLPGTERLLQIGGDGTPEVAEFAALELAVALGVPHEDAHGLMLQALALKHRHPLLWALLLHGFVDPWLAARIVQSCRELHLPEVRALDAAVAPSVPELPPGRLMRMVEGLVLDALPPDEAERRRQEAREQRGVWVEQRDGGVAGVSGVLDAVDGRFLDATLDRLARILQRGGSTESEDIRRARSLGVLASPARALQLLQADLCDELDELVSAEGAIEDAPTGGVTGGLDVACPARGQRGHTCGRVVVAPEALVPTSVLYVHVDAATLRDGDGVVRPEGLKPQLVEWLGDLLGQTKVFVRPVLDVAGMAAVDSYEVPDRMREAVGLRNPYGAAPWSSRGSRRMQLDHTRPFDHGDDGIAGPGGRPPRPASRGQTRPGNLGPLPTIWHRAKTHGGYRLEQPAPGVFLWTTPLGQRVRVSPSGSRRLPPPG